MVVDETVLFAGVDDALRMKRGATTVYFETDLAGNVRRLRSPGGGDLGGYRYSAFGKTLEDTSTIAQSLRWKGRWYADVAGGIYDVRARQWSPNLGAFLTIDEFAFHDATSTLWGWPSQNPIRYADDTGHGFFEEAAAATPGLAVFGLAAAYLALNQAVSDPGVRSSLQSAIGDAARFTSPQGPVAFALFTQFSSPAAPVLPMAEHTKNARPSTVEDHENGKARRKRDRGGEEGDRRRGPNRKRPKNWKGPWPPNASFSAPEDDSDEENTCE